MTYAKGSGITAADYNVFAGLTAVAAASAVVAQNKAGYLYGIGFGDRGYGQSTPALAAAVAGNSVGQEWQTLRTVLSTLASWQNSSSTLLPPSASFNASANVAAHERDTPSLNTYDLQDLLALLDTNRLNYQVGNMTLTANAVTTTRATNWGGGTNGISAEFSVTFASEDAARYFFNTGGEVRLALAHPSTLTSRDTSWNTILNNLVVGFRANSSARLTGSYGAAQAVGYYQLTTTYQTILDGTNSGTGAYTVNDFVVQAKAATITGSNGAKGSVVNFLVTLSDQQTNAFEDVVQSGTNVVVSYLRATSVFTNIVAPTVAATTAFIGATPAANTYATWDPATKGANATLSNGNLTMASAAATFGCARSTIGKSSGKWYWEITASSATAMLGISNGNDNISGINFIGQTGNSNGYYAGDGFRYTNGAQHSVLGATYTTGNIIGFALDMGAGTLAVYKNNVLQGTITGLTGTWYAAAGLNAATAQGTANFGATALTYTPPAGFNAGLYN